MNLKLIFFGLLFYLHYQINKCNTASVTINFISTERPVVYWYDTKYFRNFSIVSKRLNRRDPRYYVTIGVKTLFTLHNNIKMDFFFHQFLTNRYRPSFVETHFKFCDMLNSDTFFGQTVRTALQGKGCPFSPGEYYLENMSIPSVPTGFPFTKGRIYCNVSLTEGSSTKQVASGKIDMEVKVAKINS